MVQMLPYLRETPSQTAGPYVHIGLIPHQAGFDIFENPFGHVIAGPGVRGERIRIEGRILDGLGDPCREVLVEAWHADADGRYDSQKFRGWGRSGTDFETGLYSFETIKPGRVAGRHGGPQAPHVSLWLVSRGINIGLQTRMYFADEADANAEDPVLRIIDPAIRRNTLLARRENRGGEVVYVFDIRLQGESETVFFDA